MHFPQNMAREGVHALDRALRGDAPPVYLNTVVGLIADDPVAGVKSRDPAFAVRNCWGK